MVVRISCIGHQEMQVAVPKVPKADGDDILADGVHPPRTLSTASYILSWGIDKSYMCALPAARPHSQLHTVCFGNSTNIQPDTVVLHVRVLRR